MTDKSDAEVVKVSHASRVTIGLQGAWGHGESLWSAKLIQCCT